MQPTGTRTTTITGVWPADLDTPRLTAAERLAELKRRRLGAS